MAFQPGGESMQDPIDRRQALALGAAAPFVLTAEEKPALVQYLAPRRFEIEHQAVLTIGKTLLTGLEVWLPAPQNFPEQTVQQMKSDPKATLITDLTSTATVAQWHQKNGFPPPPGKMTFRLRSLVTTTEVRTDAEALTKVPYQAYKQDKTYRLFTRPEGKIETKHEEILKEGNRIKGKRRSAVAIAREAYDRVLNRTRYQQVPQPLGAAFCLKKQFGECIEYAALFVALCRVAGVPARPVVGLWGNRRNGWHVWAEFQLPSGPWIPVDPTLGDQNEPNRRYYFGNLDNRRVALCKTYDVRLPKVEKTLKYLQAGVWWYYTRYNATPSPQIRFEVAGRAL